MQRGSAGSLNGRGGFAANPTQRLLWRLDQAGEPRTVLTSLEFAGVDAVALRHAVSLVLGRHPALRSRFETEADGELRYRTDGDPPRVDMVARRRRDVAGPVRRTATGSFDLTADAPTRATVVAAGGGRAVLALCAHRIVLDEWSRQLLITQIGEAYRAVSRHRTPRLADAAHPADVEPADVPWPAAVDPGRVGAAVAGLRGAPIEVRLPRDRPRLRGRPSEGGALPGSLGPELTERLRAVADRTGGTTLVTMSSLLAATLAAETGQLDFLFGFDWLGRRQPERRHVVGMFTNMLLLRVDLTGGPSWHELLDRVRSAWRSAVDHADVPFEAVAAVLGSRPEPPVMINVHGGPFRLPDLGLGASCRELTMPRPGAHAGHELIVDVTESADDVRLVLGYPVEVFDAGTVNRLLVRLRRQASELVNSLDSPLSARSTGGGMLAELA